LDSPSHAAQHANINDAVEAMQLYAGLVLVKTQTIGTSVSSVTVTSAFSSTFDNYRIVLSGGTASVNAAELGFKLGSVTSGYYGSLPYWNHTGATGNVTTSGALNDYPAVTLVGTGNRTGVTIDVLDPNLAKATQGSATSHNNDLTCFGGFLENSANQHTAFTLIPSSGTLTGGTIRVYGYNNG
jgi:hypothetical protein